MEKTYCKSCIHYKQHYILDGKSIVRIYCGHCMKKKARAMGRKPNAAICDQYIPCPPDEEAFASREYLSKALLEKVLSLPLLPKIEDKNP